MQTFSENTGELQAAAQTLLAAMWPELNFTQGDVNMLILDAPDVPPQYAPVILAQATPAQQGTQKLDATIGVCRVIPGPVVMPESAEYQINPHAVAVTYFDRVEKIKLYDYLETAVITVLQQPKHGKLPDDNTYYPDTGYAGEDSITYLVEIGGKHVKVVYFLHVVGQGSGNDNYYQGVGSGTEKEICPNPIWKISSTLDANGNPVNTAGSGLSSFSTVWGMEGLGINLNIADLQGSALGQTTGSDITLDTNASGYGWFIDTTPGSNEEFLPTSNPNEWVAKAGSAAAGKMDMLSVLLHEYGHALGINHSADPNDFMGTTLTAGVRRLPSAEELALMQQLVGQAKATLAESTPSLTLPLQGGGDAPAIPTLPLGTSFIGFLGLLRGSRYGGVSIAPDASTLVTQYDWAANATLTNGSLNAADGWSTQGSVNIGSGAAVMNEISGSQLA